MRLANETLSAISFIHPAHAVHRSGQADIIDDTIGNIQQAINDAYNPDRGRDYEDSRDDGWQRQVSDDRRKQYNDRRRQFEDRRRQLDDRQRQLDQSVGNWKMKSGEWKMSMGVDIGAGAGIFPHATSISIPSNPASNPDGSAFSISHASN